MECIFYNKGTKRYILVLLTFLICHSPWKLIKNCVLCTCMVNFLMELIRIKFESWEKCSVPYSNLCLIEVRFSWRGRTLVEVVKYCKFWVITMSLSLQKQRKIVSVCILPFQHMLSSSTYFSHNFRKINSKKTTWSSFSGTQLVYFSVEAIIVPSSAQTPLLCTIAQGKKMNSSKWQDISDFLKIQIMLKLEKEN